MLNDLKLSPKMATRHKNKHKWSKKTNNSIKLFEIQQFNKHILQIISKQI